MAITNALGQDGGTGTQVLRSNGGATAPTFEDVGTCDLQRIAGSTYSNIQDLVTSISSSGVTSGCSVTDGGSGTIDVSSGTIMVRSTASDVGDMYFANYAGATGVALTDNSVNFVYIFYNAGTPTISISITPLATVQNYALISVVYREGSTLHISSVNVPTSQVAQRLGRRLALVDGVTHQLGMLVSETGTRNVAMTAGTVWLSLTSYSITAQDTSVADTFSYYYQDGVGGFTEVTAQTQINNTQYDDGSGSLATLSNNKYGAHWVYRGLDDDFYIIYGTGDYTLTEAQNATTPASLPLQITGLHAILCAKIIIQKSASSFAAIESAFEQSFQASLASDHNDLSALQGGTAGEYFHFTSAQHTALDPTNVALTGGAIDGTTIGATTPAAGTFDDLTLDDISGSYADAEQVFKQAGVQTTNTTPTQIAAITLTTNTMVTVEARFNGFIDDYSASCGGRLFYTARRVAGGAVEVGVPIVDVIEDSAGAPTVDADVSGNDVRLLVTGVGVETWNWVVTYNYNFTKTNA
jgi:hypothetical protein